ncbi:hypothetical protein [Colwellia sp. 12G3]|uniref:hypothetical protein n=1 Tax=Colwellia sp. 12G3 TaxID=2058299 RepID=UPI0012FED51F|nr:hypothetical protein [Colwellia sp. 12G3]
MIEENGYSGEYAPVFSKNTIHVASLTKIGNRFAQNEKLASLTGPYCIVFISRRAMNV